MMDHIRRDRERRDCIFLVYYTISPIERVSDELFGAVVAAVAIAFALAFGLGGQDAARRWLARGESSLTTAAARINAQQIRENAQNGQRQAEQARLQQQAQAYQQQQAQPYQRPDGPAPEEMPVDPTTYNLRNPR